MPESDSFAAELRELAAAPPVFSGAGAALGGLCFGNVIADRYEIVKRIGAGGMGVVFLARDRRLARHVALKVHPNRLEATEVERLHREARAMAQIAHPNVATVFDVGNFRGWLWIVMELVDGGDARAWLAQRPRTWPEIRELFAQAGRGLSAAHNAGLVHRDFKLDNVLVSVDDTGRIVRARVADFGLAQVDREITAPEGGLDGTRRDSRLTRDGAVAGTYIYMAPEQRQGAELDARADQYAFSVSLLEALTSTEHVRDAFSAKWKASGNREALASDVVPTTLPRQAKAVLLRGLSSDPRDRFRGMTELVAALERRPPIRGILGGTAIAGFTGVAIAVFAPAEPPLSRCVNDSAAASVWPAIRRERLQRSVSDLDGVDARATIAKVDGYVEAWNGARRQVCGTGDTVDEQLFDLQMRCLADRLSGLDATLTALPEFNRGQLRRALRVLPEKDALDRCLDPKALAARVPLPTDPESAEAVQRLLGELRQWPAREAAGAFVEAERIYGDVVAQARALEHPQLTARALFVHGSTLASLGRWSAARPVLEDSFAEARGCGYDHIAHQAAASLVTVIGFGIGERDAAWEWMRHAESLATRTDGSVDARMILMAAKAQLYEGDKNYEKALVVYRELVELSREVDDSGLRRAGMLTNVSDVLADLGRHEEALEAARQSAEVFAEALGPDHPNLAVSHSKIADALEGLGRMEEAEQAYRKMVEVFEGAFGSDNPQVAVATGILGEHLSGRGLHEEAIPLLSRAVEVLEAAEQREVAYLSTLLGRSLLATGRADEALPVFRSALAHHVSDPEKEAGARADLGTALFEMGEVDAAREELERALAQATERDEDDTRRRAQAVLDEMP